MPTRGGYFFRNISPARIDSRWFCLGNCLAILSSLATPEESMAIMDLIESRWEGLAGVTPLKDCYPAIENHERKIVTGCVSKNTRWNYHNGGSWPDNNRVVKKQKNASSPSHPPSPPPHPPSPPLIMSY
ncbi:hypothetical protein C1H46_002319 [Malus baccata]|uniref:Uncharacterized protein n=1 Tax=Malus baccata TaxID=106549 RepID=A0A540NM63_MALBA|nr:hypothetical protein C1H46_002319 [Malus baccata]